MTAASAPTKLSKAVRRVWQAAQMNLGFGDYAAAIRLSGQNFS